MANKNKKRSYSQETQIVKAFTDNGFKCNRMWGSNGASRGYHPEVDIVVFPWHNSSELKLQAKKKKRLPLWLGLTKEVQGVITSCDYGKKYILLELDYFINRFMK